MRLVALGRILALLVCLGALAQPAGFGQNDQLPSGETKSEPAPPAEPAGGAAQETGQGAPGPSSPEKPSKPPVPKRRARKKPTSQGQSGNVVIRNGGANRSETQLAPGMTKEQELRNREDVNRLLATTEAHLKTIDGRQLSPAQQDMRDQIRSYVAQSRAAEGAGDFHRAETLASKAHQLADELAKH
jgi:hypothetical protein